MLDEWNQSLKAQTEWQPGSISVSYLVRNVVCSCTEVAVKRLSARVSCLRSQNAGGRISGEVQQSRKCNDVKWIYHVTLTQVGHMLQVHFRSGFCLEAGERQFVPLFVRDILISLLSSLWVWHWSVPTNFPGKMHQLTDGSSGAQRVSQRFGGQFHQIPSPPLKYRRTNRIDLWLFLEEQMENIHRKGHTDDSHTLVIYQLDNYNL